MAKAILLAATLLAVLGLRLSFGRCKLSDLHRAEAQCRWTPLSAIAFCSSLFACSRRSRGRELS